MISRPSVVRLALRPSHCTRIAQRRGYAAAASSSASFETAESAGVKIASKDTHSPTTKLALVAKAGTRYQPLPGLSAGLEGYAFKNTEKRSALRITRESELLGGQLKAYHTRESLVLEASFFRDDLPYFTELFAEVVSQTRYTTHEFHEEVDPILQIQRAKTSANAPALALETAHGVAFHNGLGTPLFPSSLSSFRPYLDEHSIADFSHAAFAKGNVTLVADGATQTNLDKWTSKFFKDVPASGQSTLNLNTKASKYYGGEQRISHGSGSSVVIAFPGSSFASATPELNVLAALLGGDSGIKWSPGFSLLSKISYSAPSVTARAINLSYSDAGLFVIQISGPAHDVHKATVETVKALKTISQGTVSKEDLAKAIAKARFDALDKNHTRGAALLAAGEGVLHTGKPLEDADQANGLESVTAEKLTSAAKGALDGKATVVSVGDLHVLPWAEELGLRV